MELTSKNVRKVFTGCLYTEKEIQEIGKDNIESKAIKVAGVVLKVGFNPEKLELHKDDIRDLLSQLPKDFKKDSGGGYSFLYAPTNNKQEQWGEQRNADELLCLGLATGLAEYCITDRVLWQILPGGVPYFFTNIE